MAERDTIDAPAQYPLAFPLASPAPARVAPVPTGELELRIYQGGMRWKVQPSAQIEVWVGPVLLGVIAGASLLKIVEHHLATAALQAAVQHELTVSHETTPRLPPVPMPPKRRELPIPPAQREALRKQRRSRRRS